MTEELKAADRFLESQSEASYASSTKGQLSSHGHRNWHDSHCGRAEKQIIEVGVLNQEIFSHVDKFVGVGGLLNQRLGLIAELNASLRRISINTAIQSEKIGERGACLSVVAGLIQKASSETLEQAKIIQELATALVREAGEVCFNLGAAKIQIDMLSRFMGELNAAAETLGPEMLAEMQGNCRFLISALDSCTQIVVRSLGKFDRSSTL